MVYIETLKAKHMSMGFLDVLAELTDVDLTVDEAIRAHSNRMVRMNGTVFVALEENKVIGTASIHIIPKFVHKLGFVGLVEDVVVSQTHRGQGVGKLLVWNAVEFAKNNFSCYKIILDCDSTNIDFYQKCGFYQHETQMRMDLL